MRSVVGTGSAAGSASNDWEVEVEVEDAGEVGFGLDSAVFESRIIGKVELEVKGRKRRMVSSRRGTAW